jgi:hypothetical protein
MDSDKLNSWLQIIGAGGIIASLIFVGIQLKQSQDIAIAAQYQSRFESAVETSRATLQSTPALMVAGKNVANSIQASPDVPENLRTWAQEQPLEELGVRAISDVINMKTADNLYFQYQSGFLTDEAWLAFRNELKSRFTQSPPESFLRVIYEKNPDQLRTSFRSLLDELAAEVDAELEIQ